MKTLPILTLLLIGLHSPSLAQDFEKGDYIQNNDLERFEGNWVWTSQQDTFLITLRKTKVHIKRIDIHVDWILGWHRYIKNGKVIESSLDKVGSTVEEATIIGSQDDENKNTLKISFEDINRGKTTIAKLILSTNNPNTAVWHYEAQTHGGIRLIVLTDSTIAERAKRATLHKIPVPVSWEMKRTK